MPQPRTVNREDERLFIALLDTPQITIQEQDLLVSLMRKIKPERLVKILSKPSPNERLMALEDCEQEEDLESPDGYADEPLDQWLLAGFAPKISH